MAYIIHEDQRFPNGSFAHGLGLTLAAPRAAGMRPDAADKPEPQKMGCMESWMHKISF
jgi:hypothetical protein